MNEMELGELMNTRIKLIFASAGVLALAACTDPYTGQTGVPGDSRAQQGAVAGAIVGGIYGLQRDRDSSGKLADVAKGAAVGGILGGLGGSILDAQQRALQSDLGGTGATVVNSGDRLTVTMPESILFATDSATVSSSAAQNLYAVARNLQQYPNSRVEVVGHTDSTGTASHNQGLSERRAQSVASLLVQGGVASSRITAYGRGQTQPIASNNTAAGRAQNRRVEIIIRPTR